MRSVPPLSYRPAGAAAVPGACGSVWLLLSAFRGDIWEPSLHNLPEAWVFCLSETVCSVQQAALGYPLKACTGYRQASNGNLVAMHPEGSTTRPKWKRIRRTALLQHGVELLYSVEAIRLAELTRKKLWLQDRSSALRWYLPRRHVRCFRQRQRLHRMRLAATLIQSFVRMRAQRKR